MKILYNKNLIHEISYLLNNNKSNNLPYHNLNHLLHVTEMVNDAIEYYEKQGIDLLKQELLVAALFHDINHSGGLLTDDKNIDIAIEEFNNFYKQSVLNGIVLNYNPDIVKSFIKITEYPANYTHELTLEEMIIKDADMMQIRQSNYIQQIIIGLAEESNITITEQINNQIKFLENLEFLSEWGNEFKENNMSDIINKFKNLKNFI